MTLPFENSNYRKYQCFCCGLEFKEYEEFVNWLKQVFNKDIQILNMHGKK